MAAAFGSGVGGSVGADSAKIVGHAARYALAVLAAA